MKRLTLWVMVGSVAVLVGIGWVFYEAGEQRGYAKGRVAGRSECTECWVYMDSICTLMQDYKPRFDSLNQKEGGR